MNSKGTVYGISEGTKIQMGSSLELVCIIFWQRTQLYSAHGWRTWMKINSNQWTNFFGRGNHKTSGLCHSFVHCCHLSVQWETETSQEKKETKSVHDRVSFAAKTAAIGTEHHCESRPGLPHWNHSKGAWRARPLKSFIKCGWKDRVKK